MCLKLAQVSFVAFLATSFSLTLLSQILIMADFGNCSCFNQPVSTLIGLGFFYMFKFGGGGGGADAAGLFE